MNSNTSLNRFAIGTAQFGMDYGVTNVRGKLPFTEVTQILREATRNGVGVLDTAAAYGSAESTLGQLPEAGNFRVVTKVNVTNATAVRDAVLSSAARLHRVALDTVLLHDFSSWQKNPSLWSALLDCQAEGNVANVGLSLYFPRHWREFAEWAQRNNKALPDVVQLPLSVFDQRFAPLLSDVSALDVEIHVRSVFLQGLGFLEPRRLTPQFEELSGPLSELSALQARLGLYRSAALLLFPCMFSEVAKIVVGIDSVEQFREAMTSLSAAEEHAAVAPRDIFTGCNVDNLDIILPMRWAE